MYRKISVIICLLFIINQRTFSDISGTVKNSSGNPVAGVTVKVMSDTSKRAITAGDGTFTIALPAVSVSRHDRINFSNLITLKGNKILVNSPKTSPVSFTLYDTRGRLISQKNISALTTSEIPLSFQTAKGYFVLHIKIGESTQNIVLLNCNYHNISIKNSDKPATGICTAKLEASTNVDIAAVPDSGYFTKCVSVPNPASGLQVILGDIPSGNVIYIGNVFNSNHTGETLDGSPAANRKVYFTVLNGTSRISGTATAAEEFTDISNNYCPSGGLTGDQARLLQNQFIYRMQFTVTGSQVDALFNATAYTGRSAYALTGTVSQIDGKKVLNATSYTISSFLYPSKMTTPWVAIDTSHKKPPLILKAGTQTMKFVYIAPGKFLAGQPYWIIPSWQEDPPHMVTLTKGYYIAEIPITNGLLQSVTGVKLNGSADAGADISVENVNAFIAALSSSNPGKVIRKATSAELMYAFRAGTSNAPFLEKNIPDCVTQFTISAKSAPPNPWGIYAWLIDNAWERTGDIAYSEHNDVIDPVHSSSGCEFGGFGMAEYNLGEFEYLHTCDSGPQTSGNHVQQRVVIEE